MLITCYVNTIAKQGMYSTIIVSHGAVVLVLNLFYKYVIKI